MVRQLRDWQTEAVDAVRGRWAAGETRTAVVAATGLGKSSVIGKLATDEAAAGGRVLLLAHREELLDQLDATCKSFNPNIPVGKIQGQRTSGTRRPIVTAMVQTLRGERRQRALVRPGRAHPFDLVVVDECHRAVSDSHLGILRWAGAFDGVRTLGVTATMSRGDRRGLGDVWMSVALERDIRYGIDQGYLVEPHGRVVVTSHMDLDHAKLSRGDYRDGELGEMVAQDVDEIVKAWLEHASERITVAFAPTVESANALQDAFLAQGVAAEVVTGKTKTADRRAMYARLAAGETRVLVNVFVLVEGWDCPAVSCILMARPTKLAHVYIQAVGRGLRLSPETGKDSCLVLDVVGASRTQRLVTLIDLHETAEYDASALPPCELCDQKPCACEKPERDPDGGRRKLLGPAKYVDVDLFAASTLNWLFTHAGVRFVPAGDRLACIWTEEDGTFSAGHCATRGPVDGRWLEENVTLDEAFALAEAWAVGYDPSAAKRASSWRRTQPPSEKQVEFARRLGVRAPETMTKARLSDEISIELASRRLDRA